MIGKGETMNKFGKTLKKLREERQLSVNEVANKLFCKEQTILNFEKGKLRPNIECLVRMSLVFDLYAGDLFKEMEEEDDARRRIKIFHRGVALWIFTIIATMFVDFYVLDTFFERTNIYNNILSFVAMIEIPLLFVTFGYIIMYRIKIFRFIKEWKGIWVKRIHYIMLFLGAFYIIIEVPHIFGMDLYKYMEIAGLDLFDISFTIYDFLNANKFIFILYGILLCYTAYKERRK